jgi:hypothetical protein
MQTVRKIPPSFHLHPDGIVLFHHLLRLGRIVPQVRRFYFLFELGKLGFFRGEVKDAPVTGWLIPARIANG